jgi:Spy/CpxP family protein refolding chaperone
MARQFRWILVAAVIALPAGLSAHQADQTDKPKPRDSRPQDPPRWKWWLNADDRQELGITDEQSARIDQIFESTMAPQRAKWREFERIEDDLSKMSKEGKADVATFAEKVTQVEKLRAELATTRTVMLYQMRQVLTAQQRPKVEALLRQRAEARRKQPAKTDRR